MTVTLRYWAAARAAAGVPSEPVQAGTLSAALAVARASRGERLGAVLGVCAYVVDGDPVGSRDHDTVVLAEGALVDVLPPFAGG